MYLCFGIPVMRYGITSHAPALRSRAYGKMSMWRSVLEACPPWPKRIGASLSMKPTVKAVRLSRIADGMDLSTASRVDGTARSSWLRLDMWRTWRRPSEVPAP